MKVSRAVSKIKRLLVIWLLRQLGIDEGHIGVVVGDLTMQEKLLQMKLEHIERSAALLDEVYGKYEPAELGDSQPHPRAYVYFVADRTQNAVKIGYSASPQARLSNLQTSTPSKLELLAVIEGDLQTERHLHKRFADYRLTGEWFSLTPELATFIAGIKE